MKRNIVFFIMFFIALAFIGCGGGGSGDGGSGGGGTTPVEDTTPPSAPVLNSVAPGNNQAQLSWTQSPESDVAEYKIYMSTDQQNYSVKATTGPAANSATVTGLNNYMTFYFNVSAVDTAGNESTVSQTMSVIPPGGPIMVSTAWTLFESGNYDEAINKFDSAATLYNTVDDEANAGAGWSYAYKAKGNGAADPNYQNALNKFLAANLQIDAIAGKTIVYNVKNMYQEAIDAGKILISNNSSYSFSHDTRVDVDLIRLVIAQSAYYLGNYNEVVDQLNILDPNNNHDVNDPASLLETIQSLWQTYSY